MPTRAYTKPYYLCRLRQAYANAYATYTICMGTYAWSTIFLVELPLHLFFCIQKKKLLK